MVWCIVKQKKFIIEGTLKQKGHFFELYQPDTAWHSGGVFFAEDGRPGPSLLNFPANLGEATCGMPLSPRSKTPSSSIKESEIVACKEFLSNHEKIVVMAGADVDRENACKELVDLVENLNASVLVTMEARGVFPESHKNC